MSEDFNEAGPNAVDVEGFLGMAPSGHAHDMAAFGGIPQLMRLVQEVLGIESRFRKFEQMVKWIFCLTSGPVLPANQEL